MKIQAVVLRKLADAVQALESAHSFSIECNESAEAINEARHATATAIAVVALAFRPRMPGPIPNTEDTDA